MIASLMMYARPELEDAHNRYWQLIRRFLAEAGIESPQALSQDSEEFTVWNDPDLVLSQTCGMPYRTQLHGNVTLIGTPDFGVAGCPVGYYHSAFVVRKDDQRATLSDFKDATFAFNQTISQSGFAAPFTHCAKLGFWFENTMQSDQHILSARAVATGQADIAALDAVTWRLLCKYEEFITELRVLEWTEPTPALPYIAAKTAPRKATFDAVVWAIDALSPQDRELLGLKGMVYIPAQDYLAVPSP